MTIMKRNEAVDFEDQVEDIRKQTAVSEAVARGYVARGFGRPVAKAVRDFERIVSEIVKRDGCLRPQAMAKAAVEFPDESTGLVGSVVNPEVVRAPNPRRFDSSCRYWLVSGIVRLLCVSLDAGGGSEKHGN
jgi:hypothetical protein